MFRRNDFPSILPPLYPLVRFTITKIDSFHKGWHATAKIDGAKKFVLKGKKIDKKRKNVLETKLHALIFDVPRLASSLRKKKKERNKKQPSSLKSHESRSKRMKSFAPRNLLSALRDYYCYSWPRKSIRGILISLKEEGGSGLRPLLIISAILLAGQLLPRHSKWYANPAY